MKNRRLPFGYRMEMGELTLHIQEAEVVRWIFKQYCEGIPYNSLVDRLETQPIPYDEGKSWNKNIVARILENRRYIGERGYPAIVSEEAFDTARKVRDTRKAPAKRTEAEKLLRQLSGQRRTKTVEAQTLAILNALIDNPTLIQCPPSTQNGDIGLTAGLDEALSELPIDEERAKVLVFQTAAARYRTIGSGEYETQRLRRIAEQADRMDALDAGILRTLVESIETNQGKVVSLRLKNGQVITGVNEHENSTTQSHHDPCQARAGKAESGPASAPCRCLLPGIHR